MKTWQVDFHHFISPQSDSRRWKLVICNSTGDFFYTTECDSSQANVTWLEEQLIKASNNNLPQKIQIFRPQALSLLTLVGNKLEIAIEATRNTIQLKTKLQEIYASIPPPHDPLALDKPPPQALPENIQGEEWQLANIAAGDIINIFRELPIPIKRIPENFLPVNLGLSSNIDIPGTIIYGGRKSMFLASWLHEKDPAFLKYISKELGVSGGFILETGLIDRWVFNTIESPEIASIAEEYERKKNLSQGLHFLLIQPDNSGMTHTGFWLLKQEYN